MEGAHSRSIVTFITRVVSIGDRSYDESRRNIIGYDQYVYHEVFDVKHTMRLLARRDN
jgi:hypothetical protein